MAALNDMQLVRDYATSGSSEAFGMLVERHLGMVWSVAWRHTADPKCAEEISQAVFLILAGKIDALRPATVLSSWLFHTARLASATFLRENPRRGRRDSGSIGHADASLASAEIWRLSGPLLDEAIARLSESERNAVALRFVEGQGPREIAAMLGVRADAIRARIDRAVAKIREHFRSQGVPFSAALLARELAANASQVPPPGLARAIVSSALTKTAPVAAAADFVKATLKSMPWTSQISRSRTDSLLVSARRRNADLESAASQPEHANIDRLTLKPIAPPEPAEYVVTEHIALKPATEAFYYI